MPGRLLIPDGPYPDVPVPDAIAVILQGDMTAVILSVVRHVDKFAVVDKSLPFVTPLLVFYDQLAV